MADVSLECESRGHIWSAHHDNCDSCERCNISFDDYRNALDKKFRVQMQPCECGAEKAGFDSHSHWCPKADK